MFKKLIIIFIIMIMSAASFTLSGCSNSSKAVQISAQNAYSNLLKQIPADLNLPFAQTMSAYIDSELGFSLSGTKSATQTAELIETKMNQIGLGDVVKEEFTCSAYSFRSAQLSYRTQQGNVVDFRLSALPSESLGEKQLTLIGVGNGTIEGYKGVTASGKAVLAVLDDTDVNTLKYVIEQARSQGAAALITATANANTDPQLAAAYDIFSYSAASSMPVLNMTEADAKTLLAEYNSAVKANSAVVVTLKTDFNFTDDVIGYNVVGVIPGFDKTSKVIVTADYDRFFYGYNENNCSVALMLGLAQAIKESGYTPQKTLVFVAYGGSELSQRNTGYSAAYGAYIQLTQTHPEWAEWNSVHIDITMPAADHGTSYPLAVSTGLETYVSNALSGMTGLFANGVTVSNNVIGGESGYVFESVGIPTVGLDLDASEFAAKFRHTNLDNSNRYDAEAFRFSYELYAKLLIAFDQTAVTPYHFLPFFTDVNNHVDLTALVDYGIDTAEIKNSAYAATVQAQILNYYIRHINDAYEDAVSTGEYSKASRIYSAAAELNGPVKDIFKRINTTFFVLDSHNRKKNSFASALDFSMKLSTALTQFDQKKVSDCITTCLTVGELKYTFMFDASVCKTISDAVNNGNKKTLYWADGKIYAIPAIYDTLWDLYLKRNATYTTADFIEELDSLEGLYSSQIENLISAFESRTVSCRLFAGEAKKLIASCEKFEGYFN